MDRIQNDGTVYQDNPKPDPLAPPRFNARAARKARQVVALGPDFMRPVHRLWASLGTGTYRSRLLAGIVLVALAGGVVGGLLAANRDHEGGIDTGSLAVGAEAEPQTDRPAEPVSKTKKPEQISQPANAGRPAEFEGSEFERAVVELRKHRSSSRPRKAYKVATIYPRDYEHSGRERKRGKH
jgi:hypothetical protein